MAVKKVIRREYYFRILKIKKLDVFCKIRAFSILGKFMRQFTSEGFVEHPDLYRINVTYAGMIKDLIENVQFSNSWFTPEFVTYSITANGDSLHEDRIKKWIADYPGLKENGKLPKDIGVIMAGNIPMTGFHDFVTILLSGNRIRVRLSSKDDKIIPAFADILKNIEPGFNDYIFFEEDKLKNIDAIIATGSDNSARYFEYYFGKQPHIFRKNRNSIAVLTGDETEKELKSLADDIFIYFGLGCRNVSKIFIPEGYDIPGLLNNFNHYAYLYNHNKYANNYDYQRAIFLMNRDPHFDNGFLLLKKESDLYSSPVGCLYYENYNSLEKLTAKIKSDENMLQCILSKVNFDDKNLEFGTSQKPMFWDYSDNVDTMKFLLNL